MRDPMVLSTGQRFFRLLFAFNLALLLLLGFAYAFAERGSASYVALVLAGAIVILSLIGNGLMIYLDLNPFDQ